MTAAPAARRRVAAVLLAVVGALLAGACAGSAGRGDDDGEAAGGRSSAATTGADEVGDGDGGLDNAAEAPAPGAETTTSAPDVAASPGGRARGGGASSATDGRSGADVSPATTEPAASSSSGPAAGSSGQLREVGGFGSNPGRIRMFEYAPVGLPPARPVVVVLHGCTQTAEAFDDESGWTALADRHRFALVLPQQDPGNNSSLCWNFFLAQGNTRDAGEVLSIRQMVDWAVRERGGDAERVYVTGLSAGAAMTNVMLATYPDVFRAGAPIAGVAFKCATNPAETVPCNQGVVERTPRAWGDLVRGASSWAGPWPRVSVWHGDADGTVSVRAMPEIVKQWTNVHATDADPDVQDTVVGYPHAVYRDASGRAVVETYTITGMGHGQPVDPSGTPACGVATGYFLDARLCAAARIADWFDLDG